MPKNSKKARLLIIEDEQAIREMIKFAFYHEDFILDEAENIKEAHQKLASNQPNLILLDWMLPGKSGIDFAKELKKDKDLSAIPIIMLTAKAEEKNKLKGFNAGIDDYVTKPFSPKVLLARIHAVLRRSNPSTKEIKELNKGKLKIIKIDKLSLNPETHRVAYPSVKGKNKELNLGPLEYKLLYFFMTHTERVYSRSELLNYVWGEDCYIEDRTVDVHIRRLRKVLEKCKQEHLIQTVRGSGYRFSKS